MIKFYKWLYRLSEKKMRELCPPYCDLKCPNCNVWSKVVPPKEVEETEIGYNTVCGQCGVLSCWDTAHYPVPVLIAHTSKSTPPKENDQ